MKNRITLLIVFAAGLLASSVLPRLPLALAVPPGSQTTFSIVDGSADETYLLNHEPTAKAFARLAKRVLSLQAKLTVATAARDAMGVNVREGLVTSKAALDALLPALLYDVAIEYGDPNGDGARGPTENDVKTIKFNADAEAARDSPPAGVTVGP